jgi:peroxiredoxin Q/BCP
VGIINKILKDKGLTHLKEGDKAPDFSGKDQAGKVVELKDFKGKKLVLYFYPKDDTPGCTAESCNLRDNYSDLKKLGIEIIGISADDEKSHSKFAQKYGLPFRLIADTGRSIIDAYGVWGEKTVFGKTYDGILRTTFVINEAGFIEKVFSKVDTAKHSEQIFASLQIK